VLLAAFAKADSGFIDNSAPVLLPSVPTWPPLGTLSHNQTYCQEKKKMDQEFVVGMPQQAAEFVAHIQTIIDAGGSMLCPSLDRVSKFEFHSMPPKASVYVQVHGFHKSSKGVCLLCSFFKKGGEVICVHRGSTTDSYSFVLTSFESVITSLSKVKAVFMLPTKECSKQKRGFEVMGEKLTQEEGERKSKRARKPNPKYANFLEHPEASI